MVWTYATHPGYFSGRASQVSVFARKDKNVSLAATLRHTIGLHMRQFNIKGDQNWRHNYPPVPQLEPLTGALFLGGLTASFILFLHALWRRLVQRAYDGRIVSYGLLGAWFFALQAPAFFSMNGNSPSALRSIGVTPVIFIFAALAFDALLRFYERFKSETVQKAMLAAIAVFCTYTLMFTASEYFVAWGHDPRQPRAFGDTLERGAALAAERLLEEAPEIHGVNALKLLHQNPDNINATDARGNTALARAAIWGHSRSAHLLLAHGADANSANRDGFTPLMHAAQHGRADVVQQLLEHGVNLNATNKKGATALQLAQEAKRSAIALMLQTAQAQQQRRRQ